MTAYNESVSINVANDSAQQRAISPRQSLNAGYVLTHEISPFRTGELFNKGKEMRKQAQMKALRGATWLGIDRKVWVWSLLVYGIPLSLVISNSYLTSVVYNTIDEGFATWTNSHQVFVVVIMLGIVLGWLYRSLYSSDPGWLNGNSSLNTMPACQYCGIIPTLRSKHSNYTGQCVHKYDHYCSFLSTDIGDKNHARFWVFIAVQFFLSCWIQRVAIDALFNPTYKLHASIGVGLPLGVVNQLQVVRTLYLGALAVGLCIPILFLGYLLSLHTYLALTNQTTYELVKGASVPYLWPYYYSYSGPKRRQLPQDFPRVLYSHMDSHPTPHPFSAGPLRNLYVFFFKPKPYDYQYKTPMPPLNWQLSNDLFQTEETLSYAERNGCACNSSGGSVEP